MGPSPRVRGSLLVAGAARRWSGSIPAGAGEPRPSSTRCAATRVHPRGCGGAVPSALSAVVVWGPSPRVRGSPLAGNDPVAMVGSIPAGAGEPGVLTRRGAACRVHPRGCGGAASCSSSPLLTKGPSPRVRGSPRRAAGSLPGDGSIPAGAGEPPSEAHSPRQYRVHPRGCGGACSDRSARVPPAGPSPRVRGSLLVVVQDRHRHGSIPAGAGEPSRGALIGIMSWVHPRGCGGAFSLQCRSKCVKGPSPRVRGSRIDCRGKGHADGSIPAGAGEP